MSEPMGKLLDELIDRAGGEAPVQLTFRPGVTTTAGALRAGPVDGIYCLATPVQATNNTPGALPGSMVMVEQFFAPSAVQTVVMQMEQSSISLAGDLVS